MIVIIIWIILTVILIAVIGAIKKSRKNRRELPFSQKPIIAAASLAEDGTGYGAMVGCKVGAVCGSFLGVSAIDNISSWVINFRSYNDLVRKYISELSKGFLIFNPPAIMRVGKSYELQAIIGKSKEIIDTIKKDIGTMDEISVGAIMGVRLSSLDFLISNINEEFQYISDIETASWKWIVKPLKKGVSKIYLKVSLRIKIEGYDDEIKDAPLYERAVLVKINPVYTINTFVCENWKWIISTVAGSGIIFSVLKICGVSFVQ